MPHYLITQFDCIYIVKYIKVYIQYTEFYTTYTRMYTKYSFYTTYVDWYSIFLNIIVKTIKIRNKILVFISYCYNPAYCKPL